jgi:transposase
MQRGKFYIGIDWATEKHAVCVTDAEGNIIKERSVPNDSGLFAILFVLIAGAPSNEVCVAIETRRLVLVEALVARGFKVFTINPKQSERFRDRFSVAGAKDDRFDARVLASALRTDFDLFRAVEPESRQQIRLRTATRMTQTAKEQLREVANRLRDIVMTSMPLLLGLCNGADEAWFWDLVLLAPSPDTASDISDEKLKELLRRHRIRRVEISALQDVLKGAHLDAAAGVCEGAAWQAKLLVAQLQLLATQERAADAEVAAALRDLPKTEGSLNDAEIIMSAPGFAEHTTGVLLAEAGAVISRCDYLELRAVCGVAPVTKSSGKRREKSKWTKNQNVDGVVVMRRAVNMRLRNAVHHAGNTASRDPRFAPIYARLRATGANHARAVRGVVDRLLGVLIAMLRSRTLYKPLATTTA